ncbi:hypothetical protein RYH80_04780 [Halobaculum sp. MBLA0147]|uniref:DUF7285 family protein n=1 Tax=Halobaculum sp. MBLA0147 TaxID=3079934 RepID=UPI0035249ADA
MSRSSRSGDRPTDAVDSAATDAGRRAQSSPTVGLVAAFAVVAGVSLYATALVGVETDDSTRERRLATTTLDRAHAAVTSGGVAVPARLRRVAGVAPADHDLRVRLRAAGRTWTHGPEPPPETTTASRRVGVSLGPGRIRPGELTVEVWS